LWLLLMNEAVKIGVLCEYKKVHIHHCAMPAVIAEKSLEQRWESGLCNCCGSDRSSEQCRFFCCALFCQCCAQADLLQKSGLSQGCCFPCLFYCVSSSFSNIIPCIAICNLHQSVAHASHINEDTCTSCLKVCCCTPCALNQINSQIILTGKRYHVENAGFNFEYLMGYGPKEKFYSEVPQDATRWKNSMGGL
jgi:Cys-rich protein (TIGR01571 family)